MRDSLYRARRRRLPPLPPHRSDIDIQGEWAETLDSRRFLLCHDGQNDKIIIFATDHNLKLLPNQKLFMLMEHFALAHLSSIKFSLCMPSRTNSSILWPTVYCLTRLGSRTNVHLISPRKQMSFNCLLLPLKFCQNRCTTVISCSRDQRVLLPLLSVHQ